MEAGHAVSIVVVGTFTMMASRIFVAAKRYQKGLVAKFPAILWNTARAQSVSSRGGGTMRRCTSRTSGATVAASRRQITGRAAWSRGRRLARYQRLSICRSYRECGNRLMIWTMSSSCLHGHAIRTGSSLTVALVRVCLTSPRRNGVHCKL